MSENQTSFRVEPLWGKARKEPKYRPLDPDKATDVIVHRETGEKMRLCPIKGWVPEAVFLRDRR